MARIVWVSYNNLTGEYALHDSPKKRERMSFFGSLDDFIRKLNISLPKDRKIVVMSERDFPDGSLDRIKGALSGHKAVYMREEEKDN